MPFPGGGADKVGNRYELRWTVWQFIKLLRGDAAWIHLEPIGAEGERIEFRLGRNDGRIEVHQVKRQQTGKGHWTVADLDRVGVLEGVRKHTVDGGADFVFVSTQAPRSLPELQYRAEIAPDFPAFRAYLSHRELRSDFDDLQNRLGIDSGEQTWRIVRQSRWIAQDERELGDTILALLGAYLTGDPQAALGVLAMFALDAVHRRITPQDLWGELERRGILPSDVTRDKNLVVRLRQRQEDYLQSQEFTIGDFVLPRTEADTAIVKFLDPTESTRSIFLVGPAGVGKTGVAGQIVQRMAEIGWLVLPLRLDRLDPTQRPVEIGRQLLGREKSPVAILAGLAAGRDCLLVIEQLDAVSVVSGRRPEVFDTVAALVREARAHSNMRLLLVCRAFDLDNDQRLRELQQQEKTRATSISVGPLDPVQVKEAIAHLGLSLDRLTPGQIELLRLPLHLALLAGMTGGDDGRSLDFVSPKDLYDAFWRRKRTDLLPELGDQNSFEILLYDLCDAINDQQALSAPRGLLRSGDADLDRLVSAHVLVRQGSRIGFFHESFFDYVFARRFCETGKPLLEFLRSAEQDLFRRSQVRQILAHRRDDDFDAYLDDLRNCLAAPDVRFHIKKLIIGVVGQVSDPRPEKWAIFKDYLQEWTGRLADSVRSALWSSTPWFRFLHDQGVLAAWLASDCSETRTFGFHWLSRMVESEPNRVADLLEGLAGLSQEQDDRVLAVVTWPGAAVFSERIETLFYRLATQPERDWTFTCKAYQGFINTYCYHPDRGGIGVACRALGCWLGLLMKEPGRADLFAHDQETQNVITEHQLAELAKRAPETLVEAAMEPFQELLEQAAAREGAPPFADRIWHPGFQELTHWASEYLLVSLVDALKQIAASSPDQFSAAIDRLRRSECRTAHGVLLRALAVENGAWKSFVIDYLAETWSRWGFWYDDQARWDCRCLLQILAPFLDEADVARLEPWLLNHFERWRPSHTDKSVGETDYIRRRVRRFRRRHGREQFELLGALPSNKLSPVGRRRIGELSRKASSLGWQLDRPLSIGVDRVVSPLPEQTTVRMTDAQWLSAVRKYANDREWVWLEDQVLGGARELARILESQTKAQPERFARLMLALPDEANEHYFEAIVMGLQDGELPLDLLERVIERAHNRPGRPHGRWLPRAIASHGGQGLSTALLDVVAWYATEDPDPAEELWRKEAGENRPYYGGDPYMHGINTVRGSAAMAVANLIAQAQHYWEYFAPVLERMVADPSIAVRTCVARACTLALRYDRPKATALFLRLCEVEDDVLAVRPIEEFLHYTAGTEFGRIQPLLERMLASPIANTRRAAARQATLAALSEEAARPLAEAAINGEPETRRGAAEILSRNILAAPDRAYCEASLRGFFGDSDHEVRRAAGDWTRYIRDQRIDPVLPVAEAFVESPAFAESAETFFRAIEEAVDAPPSLLFRAGYRFIDLAGLASADLRESSAVTAKSLSNLILRAYRQAEKDPNLRRQCLDLFDRLLEARGYGADEAIEAFSR